MTDYKKRKFDLARILIIAFGFLAGIACFILFPYFGNMSPDVQSTITTVFSIFAGFQLAIFASLSALSGEEFRTGNSRSAAKRSVKNRMRRQFILFYLYIVVIVMIVIDQFFFIGNGEANFARLYASLSVSALVWSLELPRALASVHDDTVA